MTKDFYEKNYESFVPLMEECECEDSRFCNNLCPLREACGYFFTGDDTLFEEEEE